MAGLSGVTTDPIVVGTPAAGAPTSTYMRSAISTASSTSCVITTEASPSSRAISQYHPRISARVMASSAENGSSSSTTSLPMR